MNTDLKKKKRGGGGGTLEFSHLFQVTVKNKKKESKPPLKNKITSTQEMKLLMHTSWRTKKQKKRPT